MSKIKLRKELASMDKEQLMELILEAYSARKETKEYFDFFLNPDIDKLREKYKTLISKELSRVRRGGYCKARISYIKKQLKEFASFHPGFEEQLEMMIFTLGYAMVCETHLHFPETLMRGMAALVHQILDFADVNLQVDVTIKRLHELFANPDIGSRYFRRYLNDELAQTVSVRL